MSAVDRVREARQVYAAITEATQQLDETRAALLATLRQAGDVQEQFADMTREALQARRQIRRELAALQADSARLRAALRTPLWWAFTFVALGAFAGHFLGSFAATAAGAVYRWLFG